MSTVNLMFLMFVAILFTRINHVLSHGYLIEPAQRSSKWRVYTTGNQRRFPNAVANYNDNELFCGGFSRQWNQENAGRCGACGDPYDAEDKPNENGVYADDIITGNYTSGGVLNATAILTAYHKGWFEFRLCVLPNATAKVNQTCLDSNLLHLVNESTTRVNLTNTSFTTSGSSGYSTARRYTVSLQLPPSITNCTQCVLQWKYNTGNSWGCDDPTDQDSCCIGCGPQENFVNCADIRIKQTASSTTTTTQSSSTSSTTSTTQSSSTSSTTSTTQSSSTSSQSATMSAITSGTTTTTSPTTTTTTPTTTTTTTPTTTTTTSTTTTPTTTTTNPTTTTTASDNNYQACVINGQFNGKSCSVVSTYAAVPGMFMWCCYNCSSAYCPPTHCECVYD